MSAPGRPAPSAWPSVAAAHVLVADDSPTNVFVLAGMLRVLGIPAVCAANGAEAVEMARARPPALVFMDMQMPRLDGIAAARAIRAADPGRRVAIVAVTASPGIDRRADFRAAGFDDLLLKPVELPAVRRVVERWIGNAAPREEPSPGPPA